MIIQNIGMEFLNGTESNQTHSYISSIQHLPDEGYVTIAVYLIFIGCLALVANLFVITVLLKGSINYHDIHHKLLVNIVVSDLLVTLIAIPLSTASSLSKHWLFGDIGCTLAGYCVFLFCLNDMNTHAAIAVLRYIIVCKPEYEFYLKGKWAIMYFFVPVWGHTIFFTTLPFFGMSQYSTEAFGVSCSIDWVTSSTASLCSNIVIVLCCYFLHVSIFVFCYSNVIKKFSEASGAIARLRGEIIADAQTIKLEVMLRHHKILTYRKVALASLAMVAVFMVAWTPYALASVCFMFTHSVPVWVRVVPTMMAKSSVVLSPLSCALFSCSFRKAAWHLLCGTPDDIGDIPEIVDLRTNNHLSRYKNSIEMFCGEMSVNGVYIGRVKYGS